MARISHASDDESEPRRSPAFDEPLVRAHRRRRVGCLAASSSHCWRPAWRSSWLRMRGRPRRSRSRTGSSNVATRPPASAPASSASRTVASMRMAGTSPARWAACGRSRSSSSTACGSGSTASGLGRPREFRSGWGYTEVDLPPTAGLRLERTDFVPDGRRAALFGLTMTNTDAGARTVTVKVDAHSELMAEYPWSFGNTPHASEQLRRHGGVRRGRRGARFQGPRNAPASERAAARLHGAGGIRPRSRGPGYGPLAERVPRAAGDERLQARGAAQRVRRRAVRKGRGGAAALRGHRAGPRLGDAVDRGGGLRPGPGVCPG